MTQREIKFRAFHKDKKEIGHVVGMSFDGRIKNGKAIYPDTMTVIFKDGEEGCSREEVELMQYTGLKDKNGKEIWEGDVVRDKFSTREIIWHMPDGTNNIYGFTQRGIDSDEWIGLNRIDNEFEIIGNIYENPDLLIHHE